MPLLVVADVTVGGVRKQYHFRPSPKGLYAWDVDRLIELTADLPDEQVPLSAISDLDSDYWFSHGYTPTVRAVVEHIRLVNEVDLTYSIILGPDGRVMDGMHRVARALLDGTRRSRRSVCSVCRRLTTPTCSRTSSPTAR